MSTPSLGQTNDLLDMVRRAVGSGRLMVPPPDFAEEAETVRYGDATAELVNHARATADAPVHVYLHVPLCDERCSFCMYYYSPAGLSGARPERCARQLSELLADDADERLAADALYAGGGTPSVLSPDDLATVLTHLTAKHPAKASARFTVEMSPRSATVEKINVAAAVGANRFSFGVQSFDSRVLSAVHRAPAEPHHVEALLHAALDAGARDVNIDLLHGIDVQPVDDLVKSLDVLCTIGTPTITLYRHRPVERQLLAPRALGRYIQEQTAQVVSAVKFAESYGYEFTEALSSECVRLYRSSHHRSMPRLERRYSYQTQADPMLQNHLVGYGSGAQSLGGGEMRFTCPHSPEFGDVLADRDVTMWRATQEAEFRMSVVRALYWDGSVDVGALRTRFADRNLEDDLSSELEILQMLGALEATPTGFRVTASGADWAVYDKVLYPTGWLMKALAA